MKRYIKEHVLGLLDTLEEALEYLVIKKQQAAFLKQDCLSCIATIETITEEELTLKKILYLKECKVLIAGEKYESSLDLARKFHEFLRVNVPAPKEIVFLPYKAEMWDAFDSIWKAIPKDGTFHISVIPIPYRYIDMTRKLAEAVYEGDRFPAYLDIVDYREFNLQLERPAVIFIHNPYDANNIITEVFPQFFSSELIKYTDKLVYIPYFVSTGIGGITTYRMPGVSNSWRTFVQSEGIKEYCINNKIAAEEQFVAIGSPKFDRIFEYAAKTIQFSDEWGEKTVGKKFFFLNTHLDDISKWKEKYTKNLRYIVSVFKNREDAVLLWRPHPLSLEKIKSMNPERLDEYETFVDEFKQFPNGIYDATPDFYAAMKISDAYIGANSSLETIYSLTQKPMILTEGMNLREEEDIVFSAMTEYNGFIYCSAQNFNGLFRICVDSEKYEYLGKFPVENGTCIRLHKEAHRFQKNCWFIPGNAKELHKLNLETNKITVLPLQVKHERIFSGSFVNAIPQGEFLWLFPIFENHVIRLNMRTDEIKYLNNWPEGLTLHYGKLNFRNAALVENILYLFPNVANQIVLIDTNTFQMQGIVWNFPKQAFCESAYDGESFWFPPKQGDKITKWNSKSGEYSIFDYESEWMRQSEVKFCRTCFFDGAIWIFPNSADCILKINPNTGNTKEIWDFPEEFQIKLPQWLAFKFSNVFVLEDKLFICSYFANKVLYLKKGSDRIYTLSIRMPKKIFLTYTEALVEQGYFLSDGDPKISYALQVRNYSLQKFVQRVCDGDLFEESKAQFSPSEIALNLDGSCGEKIWEYILAHFPCK